MSRSFNASSHPFMHNQWGLRHKNCAPILLYGLKIGPALPSDICARGPYSTLCYISRQRDLFNPPDGRPSNPGLLRILIVERSASCTISHFSYSRFRFVPELLRSWKIALKSFCNMAVGFHETDHATRCSFGLHELALPLTCVFL